MYEKNFKKNRNEYPNRKRERKVQIENWKKYIAM